MVKNIRFPFRFRLFFIPNKEAWTLLCRPVFIMERRTIDNYMMLTNEKIAELKLDPTKYNAQDIVAVDDNGKIDPSVRIYDISLTRNVVQMLIGLGSIYLGDAGNCKKI